MGEEKTIIGDIRFVSGLREKYVSLGAYDSKTLYWCEDSRELFKGNQSYSEGVRRVDDIYALSVMAKGVIYMQPDGSGYLYDHENSKWIQVIYPVVTVLDENCTDTQIPSAKAVYEALKAVSTEGTVELSAYLKKADAELIYVKAEDVATTYATKIELEAVDETTEKIKYEIFGTPTGTLVDYREKEIRVMCPDDAVFVKQNVGSTGNANMYYMGFKAYAPEGAVGFKEGDQGVIEDEYFDFTGDFAGTDKYGRNYSVVWLPLATYDETTDTWTYFGKSSSSNKYIGWTYMVEWYNADGVVISSDRMRINLSNEDCHLAIEPYYLGQYASAENLEELQASIDALEVCCTWAEM